MAVHMSGSKAIVEKIEGIVVGTVLGVIVGAIEG